MGGFGVHTQLGDTMNAQGYILLLSIPHGYVIDNVQQKTQLVCLYFLTNVTCLSFIFTIHTYCISTVRIVHRWPGDVLSIIICMDSALIHRNYVHYILTNMRQHCMMYTS